MEKNEPGSKCVALFFIEHIIQPCHQCPSCIFPIAGLGQTQKHGETRGEEIVLVAKDRSRFMAAFLVKWTLGILVVRGAGAMAADGVYVVWQGE